MHHQRLWTSSLAVIPQTLSLPPASLVVKEVSGIEPFGTGGDTHTLIHTCNSCRLVHLLRE